MLKMAIAVVLTLALSSCGFHLRGNLPLSQFPAVYVQSDAHSELAELLNERLSQNSVRLLDSKQADAPTIQLVSDTLERRTLSLFPSGQVAEYELIYKVSYYLIMPGAEPAFNQFELYRDYQDDPNQALAKARELDLLLSELRQQAANRIIRQMARLN
ncbi:LPS-assembly lipoprotein [Arsukibacterium tuosuense]|uniref:LPS-assembly lipoprotein LptE n=1 Tax=Arsukibacterium tuosuense TaxID=1323745 RepID=A0A285J3Y1_9GAMM|nr:LPS assembly lipoprotein LptE [Arsukibacterium tuosuense]SNY54076.1 LPS-assembly lipoprotein [Arsukibacterium tuosuense]